MKLKFKNITKCSKQIYYDFIDFHNKKYGKKESAKIIGMILAVAYIIIFNVVYNRLNFLLILSLIGVIALVVHQIIRKYKVTEKELKSSRIKNQEEIIYNFYERYFEIINNKKTQKMKYYKLYKIHQDKTNFYFYIDETHAYIIDKRGFVKGSLTEFREFISKKCRFKYKKN